jgi:hypothetical protein
MVRTQPPRVEDEAPAPLATPEYTLVLAIVHQAMLDLRPGAPAHERATSVQFFRRSISSSL